MDKLYRHSLESAKALDTSMGWTYSRFMEFKGIRAEMKRFLVNLAFSNLTASRDQQIHCLFVALNHLDNVEKELRIADISEEMIRLEGIFNRIQSLQKHLFDYIGYLIQLDKHQAARTLSR